MRTSHFPLCAFYIIVTFNLGSINLMKSLLLFFFILVLNPCFSQNVDSLKKVAYGSSSAPKRLKAAVALSDHFSSTNAGETFKAAKMGLTLAAKLKNQQAGGLLLLDIGKAWVLNKGYDSAAYYSNQAAAVFEKTKDGRHLVSAWHLAALICTQRKDASGAIAYYGKIIALGQNKGSGQMAMNALDQSGLLYESTGDYKNALKCYRASQDIRDSLNIAQKTKDSISVSYSLDLIGDVFANMKQKDNSEQGLLNTIETKRSLNDTLAMAINYMNLGILYEKQRQYPKALDALQQCLQYSDKIKYTDLQSGALNELADLFEQTGNFRQATIYFKKHRELANTLNNDNSSKNVAALQTKYENTQNENRVLQQQLELTRRNYWVGGITIVLVLILLLTYSYYKRTELKQQNIATTAIIETEEKERKRIAQDLHDSVSQLMMAAKINLNVIGNDIAFSNDVQKDRFQKAINLVDEGFKEVRTISHNMMPQALLESGLALVIKQFIENIENDSIKVNYFTRGFEDHFDDTTETILYRILQECVNNVLKHAKASRLDISLIRDETNISLTIEDNGSGFDMSDKQKFSGMGLKNLQNRVNFIKGKIEIDSHPGQGTLVSVYIPLKK